MCEEGKTGEKVLTLVIEAGAMLATRVGKLGGFYSWGNL